MGSSLPQPSCPAANRASEANPYTRSCKSPQFLRWLWQKRRKRCNSWCVVGCIWMHALGAIVASGEASAHNPIAHQNFLHGARSCRIHNTTSHLTWLLQTSTWPDNTHGYREIGGRVINQMSTFCGVWIAEGDGTHNVLRDAQHSNYVECSMQCMLEVWQERII